MCLVKHLTHVFAQGRIYPRRSILRQKNTTTGTAPGAIHCDFKLQLKQPRHLYPWSGVSWQLLLYYRCANFNCFGGGAIVNTNKLQIRLGGGGGGGT